MPPGGRVRGPSAPIEEGPASEAEVQEFPGASHFVTMILDNLEKAGVQNTRKTERLNLDSLEPFAGTWIHATGT